LLALAILSSLFIFLSSKKADVPVNLKSKNQNERTAQSKGNTVIGKESVGIHHTLNTSSFRVVPYKESESVFNVWSIYAILKIPGSSANGGGC